jgi:hypothetical protein
MHWKAQLIGPPLLKMQLKMQVHFWSALQASYSLQQLVSMQASQACESGEGGGQTTGSSPVLLSPVEPGSPVVVSPGSPVVLSGPVVPVVPVPGPVLVETSVVTPPEVEDSSLAVEEDDGGGPLDVGPAVVGSEAEDVLPVAASVVAAEDVDAGGVVEVSLVDPPPSSPPHAARSTRSRERWVAAAKVMGGPPRRRYAFLRASPSASSPRDPARRGG